jgi:hypothetical protein
MFENQIFLENAHKNFSQCFCDLCLPSVVLEQGCPSQNHAKKVFASHTLFKKILLAKIYISSLTNSVMSDHVDRENTHYS